MTSLLDVPLGVQRPRVSSVPPFVSSAGVEAVELAAAVGLDLDPWQRFCLEGALGETPGGSWSAFEVGLVVPRQNGKGAVLEARELAGLFLLGEQLILHSAHEFKTAQEAFRRVLHWVEGSDELMRQVVRVRTSHGEEGIELKSGARLRFVARSTGSGRGFSGDLVILDEAYELGPAQMAALLPTLSARPNPQLWYTSSAGMQSSIQLRAVRERALLGNDPGLAYFEFSADPKASPDDRQAWAQANPALGIRITPEFVQRERAAMPEAEFLRERLGVWDDSSTAAVIPFETWAARIDRLSQACDPVTFALDVTPDRSAASIGMASRRPDGRWHVEVVDNRPGTGWLINRVVELQRWRPQAVVLDSAGPVASFQVPLREVGVEVTAISTREVGQACGMFFDAVMAERLVHIDQTPLTAAVHAARQRPLGEAWAWHRKDQTDISPLVAVTLALFGSAQQQADKPKAVSKGRVIVMT